MNDRAAVELLNDLEERHALFDLRIGAWCAWPLLKTEVMLRLTGVRIRSTGTPPGPAWRIRAALSDIAAILSSGRRDVLIKTGTGTLIDRDGDRYKDFLFDDLALALGPIHKIESVFDVSHIPRTQAAVVPAVLTTSLAEIAAGIARRLPPSASVRAAAERISRVLGSELSLAECTAQWVAARLVHFDSLRHAYRLLFGRLARKVLLVGDPGEFAAIAAARELGLRTAELQHGLITAFHPAYAWERTPRSAWPGIPVADRLFVFGDYWRDSLRGIDFWTDRIDVAGSLRMDAYRGTRDSRPSGDRTIVFTSQGIDTEAVTAFLANARRLQQRREDTRLVLKLHPTWDFDKEKFARYFGNDANVVVELGAEGRSTLQLLAESDLHLSISSFCHYEACALGVGTVVLPFRTSETMRAMLDAGHAGSVQTAAELASALDAGGSWTPDPAAAAHYFRQDALKTMRALVANLMDS